MYLNNYSNSTVTIQLVAKRELKPYSSVKLNDKDVAIIKAMVASRAGKSKLFEDVLRMSKFRIEDSSNYASLVADGKVLAAEDERLAAEQIESANVEPLDDEEQAMMDKLKESANVPQTPSEQIMPQPDNATNEDITEIGTENLTDEDKQELADNAIEFESGEALDNAIASGEVETTTNEVTTDAEDKEIDEQTDEINIEKELEAIANSNASDTAKFDALTSLAKDNNITVKKAKTTTSLLNQLKDAITKKG